MKELKKHVFIFNPKDNSGEQLVLITRFMKDGDCVLTEQSLDLNSYGNCASFELSGAQLTSANLRQLANELDEIADEIKEEKET